MDDELGGAKLLDRHVIDPDEDDPAIDDPACGVGCDGDVVLVEVVAVPETAVPGLDEEPRSVSRQIERLQVIGCDVSLAVVLDDQARPYEGFEWQVFDGGRAGEEVVGSVDVGASMRAEGEFADVVRIAGAEALVVVELDAGFAGVGG